MLAMGEREGGVEHTREFFLWLLCEHKKEERVALDGE